MRILLLLAFCGVLHAEVQLPALISDNMVLQQNMPVRIWGKAAAGEDVAVSFLGQTAKTKAGAGGRWEVFLAPMRAGGPHTMTIAGANTISIQNVLVGEVWVASGQSNMAWSVRQSDHAEQETAQANYPVIRFFQVRTKVAEQPQDDTPGAWKVCNPENAPAFSGVGYFFARELHLTRGVPIGILQSAVGGTPAQAWTSRPALENNRMLHYYLEQWEKRVADFQAGKSASANPRQLAPGAPGHPHTPSGLYNGMIAPLVPYAIRGAIWYQGEANAGPTDNELYRHLFADMILDWRRAWNQGQFPFLFVQLASYIPPEGRDWPVIRDSQTRTLEITNTAMAVAIDAGAGRDIHPKDKLTIGRRLALAARAIAYGEKIEYSGPVLRQATGEDGALRLWFDHTGSGLAARDGGKLTGFRIATEDGKFVEAEARIEGATVVVSSPQISAPKSVRYAWENDPVANLVNREGLPATPFRTDRGK